MAYDNTRAGAAAGASHTLYLLRTILSGSAATSVARQRSPEVVTTPDPGRSRELTSADRDGKELELPKKKALSLDPEAAWLALQRRRYGYRAPDDNPLAPIAVAERVPLTAGYDLRWALPYLPLLIRTWGHTEANHARFVFQELVGRFEKMKMYRQIFDGVLSRRCDLPLPQPYYDRGRDGPFARQRLDGPNPVLIRRIRDLADLQARMPAMTDALLGAALGDSTLTLAGEAAAGRLYVCDYELLQASLLPPARRDSRWRETYLPAPIALFCRRPGLADSYGLAPVAIQVDQPGAVTWDQPDPHAPAVAIEPPIFTPADGDGWELAKTLVQCADQNHQVNSTHVGRTHWLIEAFALATPRQLPLHHPLLVLLEPHLRFTLATNQMTLPLVTNPKKIFGMIYAGFLDETRNIMRQTHARWGFRALDLETDLAERGMADYPEPYPYRDDARRLWQATRTFVDRYLRVYYPSDAHVLADRYLQAWLDELVDPERGALHDLFAGPRLDTVDALVQLVAQLVFTCGPQHAAVHYPQLEYFTYLPASPGAVYTPPPRAPAEVRPESNLDALPPLANTLVEFQTDHIGDYRYDRFGDYRRYRLGHPSTEPAVKAAIAGLHADLAAAQAQIEHDNAARAQPYVYLLPTQIPNSINI